MCVREGLAQRSVCGFTLVELVVVIAVSGILAGVTPPLVFQGVRSFVFLPKTQLANQVAMEVLHDIVEGSYSILSGYGGQTIRGLRYAARQASPLQTAIWLAEDNRVGFLIPNDPANPADNQYVVLRLDTTTNELRRAVLTSPSCGPVSEEVLPYYASGRVRAVTTGPLFQYYTQSGAQISPAPGCVSVSTIRRVDVNFIAQTGGGNFDQGDAQVRVTSSAAIRFP